MTQALPIALLISGSIVVTPNAAQPQATSVGLVLGSSNVIDLTARYRVYTSATQVANDFGSSAPEALAAQAYFGQVPQPATLLIGRWAHTATSGVLVGGALTTAQSSIAAWQAIASGGVDFTVDGTAKNLSALNFSSCWNLQAVAAVINAALSGSATFVYNSSFNCFQATSATTGTSSTVSFATTGAGTDISAMLAMTSTSSGAYIAQGALSESALAAVQWFVTNVGQQFYGVSVLGAADSDIQAVTNYLMTTNNVYSSWWTSSEAGILSSSSTSDIAYLLSNGGLNGAYVQYSSSSAYAALSAMAKAININYVGNNTASILAFKQEPGVAGESINPTQFAALVAKKANIFANFDNNTVNLQPGVMCDGTWVDQKCGTDALKVALMTASYNALYTSPTKIPQTDPGMDTIATALTAVLQQFVTCGFLAPGVWTNPGFGALQQGQFLPAGFYVYTPPVSSQTTGARSARQSVPYQIAAKLAGGVQEINWTVYVNQ